MVLSERPFKLVFAILGEFFLDPHFFSMMGNSKFQSAPFLTVDGSENPANQLSLVFSCHFLPGLIHPGSWALGFLNHQRYLGVLALLRLYVVGCLVGHSLNPDFPIKSIYSWAAHFVWCFVALGCGRITLDMAVVDNFWGSAISGGRW